MEGFFSFLFEVFSTVPPELFHVAIIVSMLIGIGFLEPIFDYLHLYWISSKIRKVKELFISEESLRTQTKWVEYMTEITRVNYEALQAREYAKSRILSQVEMFETLQESKLKSRGQYLADIRKNFCHRQQSQYACYLDKPKGPRVREYEVSVRRRAQLLEQDPVNSIEWMIADDLVAVVGGDVDAVSGPEL
ncbi:hypothetical protein PRK78_003187 [Emydomyces testavorans]|uniref:Uncharacterized protein n=1 Tax=Emydomyces testavorans TaxID=2070801 RepID=A0AAF0DFQ9_9EURO|nr:hypothetical protein PRK78_003187 [Emydomyces testavorans]